jgi:hypothetical protein
MFLFKYPTNQSPDTANSHHFCGMGLTTGKVQYFRCLISISWFMGLTIMGKLWMQRYTKCRPPNPLNVAAYKKSNDLNLDVTWKREYLKSPQRRYSKSNIICKKYIGTVYIMTAANKNHEHVTLYCNSNYSEEGRKKRGGHEDQQVCETLMLPHFL